MSPTEPATEEPKKEAATEGIEAFGSVETAPAGAEVPAEVKAEEAAADAEAAAGAGATNAQ